MKRIFLRARLDGANRIEVAQKLASGARRFYPSGQFFGLFSSFSFLQSANVRLIASENCLLSRAAIAHAHASINLAPDSGHNAASAISRFYEATGDKKADALVRPAADLSVETQGTREPLEDQLRVRHTIWLTVQTSEVDRPP